MQLSQPPSRYEPLRRILFDAGRVLLNHALAEQARQAPVRFGPDGRPPGDNRAIDMPPDPRLSYAQITGCPWCQVNLRLAGVVYCLDRAIAFPQGAAAYLQMVRGELVGVRAMIAANPGEIRALENEIGQIQMRLIAQDPDIADLLRSVSHLMDVCTRAAEMPHPAPFARTPPPPTGERIYGSGTNGSGTRGDVGPGPISTIPGTIAESDGGFRDPRAGSSS